MIASPPARFRVIDRNTRRDAALKAEIAAERATRRLIDIPDPTDLTYNERTTAERSNARIKDEFGGRHLRVRGYLKAFCHLMFWVIALAADSIPRLFGARFYIHPAAGEPNIRRGRCPTRPRRCSANARARPHAL
jgi:hypothetical protein